MNVHSTDRFHLLWEQNENSKVNQYLKTIIQTHINDVSNKSNSTLTLNDFRNADLSGVKFGDKPTQKLVNLDVVFFDKANLKNVDFSGAFNINIIEVSKARSCLGIKGILGEQKIGTNRPVGGGNVKVKAPFWKGNVPRIQASIELQRKNMEECKQFICNCNDFMEILSMLTELVRSNNTNEIYVKTFVSDYMPTNFNSYKEVMILGREKLVSLASSLEVKLNALTAPEIQAVKTELETAFNETFGADCFKFWGKEENKQQLALILEKSKLNAIQERKSVEMNSRIANQNNTGTQG